MYLGRTSSGSFCYLGAPPSSSSPNAFYSSSGTGSSSLNTSNVRPWSYFSIASTRYSWPVVEFKKWIIFAASSSLCALSSSSSLIGLLGETSFPIYTAVEDVKSFRKLAKSCNWSVKSLEKLILS